jgi:hypothetical protein
LAFLKDHLDPRDLVAQIQDLSRRVTEAAPIAGAPAVTEGGGAGGADATTGTGTAGPHSGVPTRTDGAAHTAGPGGEAGGDDTAGSGRHAGQAHALDEERVAAVSAILEERKPTLAAALKKAEQLVEEPAGTIRIRFADRFAAVTVRQESTLVSEALEQALGRSVAVSILDHSGENENPESETADHENWESQDETVQMVRDVFRGQIVEE